MALDTVGNCQISANIQWSVTKSRPGLEPVGNAQAMQHKVSFTKGVNADQINELIATIHTIAPSATLNLDMSAALTNVVNDALVPLARVKFLFARLLSATDVDTEGNVIGNACSSVTIGGHASAFKFLVDATDKIKLENGDQFEQTRRSATGLIVTPTTADMLMVVNGDAVVEAKLLLVFGGCAT